MSTMPVCPFCDCPIAARGLDYDDDDLADYECDECGHESIVKRSVEWSYDVSAVEDQ